MVRGSEILKTVAIASFVAGGFEMGLTLLHGANYWQDIFRLDPVAQVTPAEKAENTQRMNKDQKDGQESLIATVVFVGMGAGATTIYQRRKSRSPVLPR